MSLRLLVIFAVTEFFLSLTPGPAVLLVVSQSMRNGCRSSLSGAMGILTGNAIYFILSALGLGALLLASATLFQIIKWIGAAYLILLGLRMLISNRQANGAESGLNASGRPLRFFYQGLLTQLSNPKAIIFFSALLPQFVSVSDSMPEQFLILGIISIIVEFPVLIAYGWAAERGSRFFQKGRFSKLPERVAGGVLISAGISLAATRRP